MKNIVIASLAALAFATPATAADFTGPRLGGNVGFADDGLDAFTYGVNAGYDFNAAGVIAGITVEYQDSERARLGRDLSAIVRVGGTIGDKALLYVLGGYTNLAIEGFLIDIELDGMRVGAGAEVGLAGPVYGTIEYRHSNYELNFDGHQMVAGVGIRF